jgi:hypothetical protein
VGEARRRQPTRRRLKVDTLCRLVYHLGMTRDELLRRLVELGRELGLREEPTIRVRLPLSQLRDQKPEKPLEVTLCKPTN